MLTRSLALAALSAAVAACPARADDLDRLNYSWKRWYEAARPADSEQKWKRVPWETDLTKAVKLARAEKRPLFLWVAFDEPLDRC